MKNFEPFVFGFGIGLGIILILKLFDIFSWGIVFSCISLGFSLSVFRLVKRDEH